MSQQEFVPESQPQEHASLNDEVYFPRSPYSWSGKLDKEATPRDEPPSSYGEPMAQQGYQAQANAGQGTPGGQGQGVPPWARPQQHRRAPFRFGFILFILVAIALIQGLIANGGALVGVTGDILGAIFGLLLFVLIVPLIILIVFSGLLMRMFRFGGPWYSRRQRWRGRHWPRGPYWW